MHVGRGRRVLDQLHQLVAQDHLALGDRDLLADGKFLHTRGRAAVLHALEVLEEVLVAARQVLAALLDRLLEHLGIGERVVGRRERLGRVLGGELDQLRVPGFDALDAVRGLFQQLHAAPERLGPDVEGVLLPGGVGEAPVAGFRGRERLALHRLGVELPQFHRLLQRVLLQFELLRRRFREVQPPVPERGAVIVRREAPGRLGEHGPEFALNGIQLVHGGNYKGDAPL